MRLSFLRSLALCLIFSGLIVAACAPTTRVHGYVPSEADLEGIRPGVDNYDTVTEAVGRPSSSGLLQDSAWYYVQSTVENYTYNPQRVIDRKVVAVKFNEQGIVSDVARFGIEDGRIVNLTARTTETGGRQLGILEQIFGNLLNLDAQQFQN